jgi:hypothetical protein
MIDAHKHCGEAQALVVDVVAEPRRLAVRLRHPKETDARSTIRINLGLDVSVDDGLGVQILDAVDHIREHPAHMRLCHCGTQSLIKDDGIERGQLLKGRKIRSSERLWRRSKLDDHQLIAGSAGVRGGQVRVAQTAWKMFRCSSLNVRRCSNAAAACENRDTQACDRPSRLLLGEM